MGAARQQSMLEQQLSARRAKKLHKVEKDNAKVAAGFPAACDAVRLSCIAARTPLVPAVTMLDFGSKLTLQLRHGGLGRNESC